MQDTTERQFKIYGFLDLKKSISDLSVDKNGIIIEGRFMNTVKDISGETPIVSEMILDILKKSGNIKYEHDPLAIKKMTDGTMMAVSEANPKNIMGAVLDAQLSPNGRELIFRATLFPEDPLTKSLVEKSKQFDEHNKRFPKNQRHFQLSAEGKYFKRDKLTKAYAALIENIVISPQAQDDSTYFQFVNTENLAMAKSIQAGYETDMKEMKGGDALRKESLLGGTKNNTTSLKEKKKMEKHGKNQVEVFQHFRKDCKTNAEAMEKTKAYMKELTEEREAEGSTLAKSIGAGVEKILQAVTAFNGIETLIATKQEGVVKVDAEMKKAISTLRENPESFSGEEFLSQNAGATIAFGTSINEIQAQMAKSMAIGFQGIAEVLPLLKSLAGIASESLEQAQQANDTIAAMQEGLKKSRGGFTTATQLIDAVGSDNAVMTDDRLLKTINVNPVKDFLVNKQIAFQTSNPALAQEYSNAFQLLDERRNEGFQYMSKSIQAEIVAFIKPQLPVAEQQ